MATIQFLNSINALSACHTSFVYTTELKNCSVPRVTRPGVNQRTVPTIAIHKQFVPANKLRELLAHENIISTTKCFVWWEHFCQAWERVRCAGQLVEEDAATVCKILHVLQFSFSSPRCRIVPEGLGEGGLRGQQLPTLLTSLQSFFNPLSSSPSLALPSSRYFCGSPYDDCKMSNDDYTDYHPRVCWRTVYLPQLKSTTQHTPA